MCDVLIMMAADQTGKGFEPGDVIHVAPDNWDGWGNMELGNPRFLLLKLPGVEEAVLQDMREADITDTPDGPVLNRGRRRTFDIAGLPPGLRNLMIAGQTPVISNQGLQTAFLASAKTKPVVGQLRIA